MRFSNPIRVALPVLLLVLTVRIRAADTLGRLVGQSGSRIVVSGDNNLHEWQIQGDVIDGAIHIGSGFPVTTNARVQLGEVAGQMEGSIPVRSLHHDSRAMDRILYQALKEPTYPRIRFYFDDFVLTRRPTAADNAFVFDADSEVVVAGVSQRRRLRLSLQVLERSRLRVTGTFKLKMTDFGVAPPEAKGDGFTITTRDEVSVQFDWLLGPEVNRRVFAPNAVRPFVAEGSISCSNRFSSTTGQFAFYSSNGWWQVNLPNFAMPPHYESQNCMIVPGGIRWFTTFHDQTNWPGATAAPITFPPPGIAGGMLQTWLCLCPNPELPRIDEKRMHRFLTVPSAPFAVLNDAVNQGEYDAKYLMPGGAFLSELSITNDGLHIEWHREKVGIWRYPAPFEEGFREFDYRVLESTNCAGLAFPSKAVANYFGIAPDDRNRLATYMTCEINISRISFDPADLQKQVHPERLHVYDYRPQHLRGTESLSLIITNDQWTAPSR